MDRFSRLLDDFEWRGSLDAFHDILRVGLRYPRRALRVAMAELPAFRESLGWSATIHWLEDTIARCHPTNVPRLTAELEAARRGEGTTLFDWLVVIIERHGPGGSEAEDNLVLRLL